MRCNCRYIGQLADHAAEVFHFMWQHDTRALALSLQVCVDAHGDVALRARHQISPRYLEMMLMFSTCQRPETAMEDGLQRHAAASYAHYNGD